jgi:hypothetical protein
MSICDLPTDVIHVIYEFMNDEELLHHSEISKYISFSSLSLKYKRIWKPRFEQLSSIYSELFNTIKHFEYHGSERDAVLTMKEINDNLNIVSYRKKLEIINLMKKKGVRVGRPGNIHHYVGVENFQYLYNGVTDVASILKKTGTLGPDRRTFYEKSINGKILVVGSQRVGKVCYMF